MEKFLKVTVNGVTYDVKVEEAKGTDIVIEQPKESISVKPEVKAPEKKEEPKPVVAAAGDIPVKAPMPGSIWKLKTAVGAAVKKNDVLLILEAMKMENEIVAPADGTVASILVKEGDTVQPGQVMINLA